MMRKYSIKPMRARANIRGASHRESISRGRAYPTPRYGAFLASGSSPGSPEDPARQVPARYEDVRCCNASSRSLRIVRRCASDNGINQSRYSRRAVPIDALAERIRLRTPNGRSQYLDSEGSDRNRRVAWEDPIAIVNQVAMPSSIPEVGELPY